MHLPDTLMPQDFPHSPNIQVIHIPTAEEKKKAEAAPAYNRKEIKEKSYTHEKIRTINKDAYKPWTGEQDNELMIMYYDKMPLGEMAKHFGRTYSAIKARINKLELE